MSISIISSIEKTTSSGVLTVPESCTLIAAFVDGSVIPPKIDGVDMGTIASVPATSIIPAISAHIYQTPAITTLPFTMSGTSVQFVYLSVADTNRPGPIFGYSSGGVFSGNIVTSATDLVIGILHGSIGPTAMKGDTVEMTYLKNSTLVKIGYVFAAVALLACLASDVGVSGGYWIDNGTLHHDAVLITPGHVEYYNTWIPGYWVELKTWVPDHWVDYNGHMVFVPGAWVVTARKWFDGQWIVDDRWIDPVWQNAWDEDLPDTWVPAGTSQLSGLFVSIKTTADVGFASSPIIFQ